MTSYTIQLSALQIEILLETVQAFVGNQKLLHLPDASGQIIGLPLTGQALETILSHLEEKQITEKQMIKVEVNSAEDSISRVTIHIEDFRFHYDVNLDEFDSL